MCANTAVWLCLLVTECAPRRDRQSAPSRGGAGKQVAVMEPDIMQQRRALGGAGPK